MPAFIKPHFAPTTLRSHFSPERTLSPSTLSLRVTFDLENPKSRVSTSVVQGQYSEGSDYIPKPKGEFNRPSNGYTLEILCKDELEWGDELWLQVDVSLDQTTYLREADNILILPHCSSLWDLL